MSETVETNMAGKIEARYDWRMPEALPFAVMRELQNFSRVQQRLFFNRGLTTALAANDFLLPKPFHSPFGLLGMDNAVETIFETIDSGGRITVYGDYDVDGVTASSLLVQVLRRYGASVDIYIPNRFEEGYGLNQDAVRTLAESGAALTITVDCGVRSPNEAALAAELGMKMIITDHHEPGDVIPSCCAVINPKRPGDTYPDKMLAGVGIAYKVAAALLAVRPIAGVKAEQWLDLVAIGSVADLVPVMGENRHLIQAGLKLLRTSSRPAVVALAQVSRTELNQIRSDTIGYQFGPRLNAAGRLESALMSYDLLMSETYGEALTRAIELNDLNRQRQTMTKAIQASVLDRVDPDDVPPFIMVASESYNMGICGLAASRITEALNRPAIVGAIADGEVRASCRSIRGFSMIDGLDANGELMIRHGGHPMAAGLTMLPENWETLKTRMTALAQAAFAEKDLSRPEKAVEGELTFDFLTEEIIDQINALQPYGMGNPTPVFLLKNALVKSVQLIGADKTHLRLELSDGNECSVGAVAFGQGARIMPVGSEIDLIFELGMNEFRGTRTVQLQVIDFRSSE